VSRGVWTRKLSIEERRTRVETPCRIGVLSDTHFLGSRKSRPLDPVFDLFRRAKVDLILHAGDVGQSSTLDDLAAIAPVEAVRGNADPVELIDALPDRVWIAAGRHTLLLLHGHHGKTALTTARAAASPGIDLIVFGHSHKPLIEQQENTILFNPGSPTERRWNPHFGVGLITVSEEKIEPELILFDDPQHLANVTP
jgi:putative phosphoesterase